MPVLYFKIVTCKWLFKPLFFLLLELVDKDVLLSEDSMYIPLFTKNSLII